MSLREVNKPHCLSPVGITPEGSTPNPIKPANLLQKGKSLQVFAGIQRFPLTKTIIDPETGKKRRIFLKH